MNPASLRKLKQDKEQEDRELQLNVLRAENARRRFGERRLLSLGRRVDRALAASALLSSAPASGTSGGRRVKPGSRVPPSAATCTLMDGHSSLAEEYGRRITLLVNNLEREVDNYKLRRVGGGDESYDERIKRLLSREYEGLSNGEVAFIDPSQGSIRTIKKERRLHSLDDYGRAMVKE